MKPFPLALACSLAAAPAFAAKLGPEWDHIKSAESAMKGGEFLQAEGALKKALDINPDEPKITEDLALVHIVFDDLQAAKSEVQQAIDISKRKQAKFTKGGKPYQAWQKYLAELYSVLTEVTILEHEAVLRPGLSPKGKIGPKVEKALGKVRSAHDKAKAYGTFKSRVDDDLITKAIDALAKKPSIKAVADEPAEDEAGADEEAGGDGAKPAAKAAIQDGDAESPDASAEAGGEAGESPAAKKPSALKDDAAGEGAGTGGIKQADVVNAMAPGASKPKEAKKEEPDPFGGPAAPAAGGSSPDKAKPAAKSGGDNPFGDAP